MKRFLILLVVALVPVFAQSQDLSKEDDLKVRQAIQLMNNGNLDKSVELLKEVQKANPKNFIVGYELGLAYYSKQDYDSAIDVFKKLQKNKDANSILYQAWGNAYDMKGQRDKARETYDKGLKLFPNSGPLYLEKGNLENMEGNYYEALLLYENGIKVDPDFTSNYFRAAEILGQSNEPIFAILYATVYRLLDPNSNRSAIMGAMIADAYREHIAFEGDTTAKVHVTLTKKNNIQISQADLSSPEALLAKMTCFELTYERGVLASGALTEAAKRKELTFDDLIEIRGDALEYYLKEQQEKGSIIPQNDLVAVLKYEKKIKDAGFWRVYNAWLMGSNEFYGGYEILGAEQEKFKEFIQWESNNLFVPSRDGLTLRQE